MIRLIKVLESPISVSLESLQLSQKAREKPPLPRQPQHPPKARISILKEGKLHAPKSVIVYTILALRELTFWKGRQM